MTVQAPLILDSEKGKTSECVCAGNVLAVTLFRWDSCRETHHQTKEGEEKQVPSGNQVEGRPTSRLSVLVRERSRLGRKGSWKGARQPPYGHLKA